MHRAHSHEGGERRDHRPGGRHHHEHACGAEARESARGSGRSSRHGFSSRSSRVFDHGDLRWVVLRLLADKPSHGYELIKAIEDRLAGAYSPSPGSVYPTLALLEDLGHIVPADGAGGARKAYAVTEEGRAALERHRPEVDAIFGKIDQVAARAGSGVSPRILRALEGVKLALRLRLHRGGLTDAQIADAVAALEAAARTIETD